MVRCGIMEGINPMASASNRRAMILLLILSGMIISICMGLRQSLGLFMRPMAVDAGVSAATFGFAIALQNIVWGVTQPFVGALADKHGPRPILVTTALLYAAGMLLMVFSHGELGLDIAGFLLGVGTAGTAFGVLIGVVTRATPEAKRSQTVGLVAASGSLGTMVLAPLGQSLINNFGWQPAMVAFAVIASSMALFALPIKHLAIVLNADPARMRTPSRIAAAARGAARRHGHRGYLFMTLAFFACGFQLVFITTHLPAYLQLCGVAPGVSATALGLIGLFNASAPTASACSARATARSTCSRSSTCCARCSSAASCCADQRHHHADLRRRDGRAVAGRLAAGDRHHRPRVRPAALSARSTAWCSSATRSAPSSAPGWAAWCSRWGSYDFAWGALIAIGLDRLHAAVADGRESAETAGEGGAVPA
jgi:MFS family permease